MDKKEALNEKEIENVAGGREVKKLPFHPKQPEKLDENELEQVTGGKKSPHFPHKL